MKQSPVALHLELSDALDRWEFRRHVIRSAPRHLLGRLVPQLRRALHTPRLFFCSLGNISSKFLEGPGSRLPCLCLCELAAFDPYHKSGWEEELGSPPGKPQVVAQTHLKCFFYIRIELSSFSCQVLPEIPPLTHVAIPRLDPLMGRWQDSRLQAELRIWGLSGMIRCT